MLFFGKHLSSWRSVSCHYNKNFSKFNGSTSREIKIGEAIDRLRSDLPNIFKRNLDFSIYSTEILLIEPNHYKFYLKGLSFYKLLMISLRHVFNFYFMDLRLDINSMHQMPDETLHVKWTIEGTAKVSVLKQFFNSLLERNYDSQFLEKSVYEGISIYKFSNSGLISEHCIVIIVIF
jgi:hypothetical protein